MEVAEMKMLKLALGVWVDKIKNEHIRRTAHVGRLMVEAERRKIKMVGHMMRGEEDYVGKILLKMYQPVKMEGGRPK